MEYSNTTTLLSFLGGWGEYKIIKIHMIIGFVVV